jgi:sulfoxide reductase heme-binding subunit YedZ
VNRRRLLTFAVVACGLTPLVLLGIDALRGALGANPIEKVQHVTGGWALRFLLLTLCVTPLRRLCGWSWLAPQRRTLGLLCFAWASLHLSVWVGLDLYFDWGAVFEDIADRPYITVGFAGFVCLVPLALTSTRGSVRRLGRRWALLHRLAYVAGALGVVHFLWLVKADLREPLIYACALGLLLAVRVFWALRRR